MAKILQVEGNPVSGVPPGVTLLLQCDCGAEHRINVSMQGISFTVGVLDSKGVVTNPMQGAVRTQEFRPRQVA